MEETDSAYVIDGTPTIRKSYCIYMDILGFTEEMLIAAKEEATEQELFRKLKTALSGQWGFTKGTPISNLWSFKVFTDNVVLGYPIFTPDGEGEFGNLVIQIGNYQLAMALEGFFIRGGFSIGNLYLGEDIVYGKALLDAYKIENEVATNPRVVLSNQVLDVVNEHLKFYSKPDEAPHNNHILVDADKQPFVNYLSSAVFGDEVVGWALRTHKDKVELNLRRFYNNPKIWSKYLWVANYHNYFCKLVEDFKGYSSDLIIDKELAVQHPKRLVE